jgi:hypothetical protein
MASRVSSDRPRRTVSSRIRSTADPSGHMSSHTSAASPVAISTTRWALPEYDRDRSNHTTPGAVATHWSVVENLIRDISAKLTRTGVLAAGLTRSADNYQQGDQGTVLGYRFLST